MEIYCHTTKIVVSGKSKLKWGTYFSSFPLYLTQVMKELVMKANANIG